MLKNTIYNFPKEVIGSYNVTMYSRNTIQKIKDFKEVSDINYIDYYTLAENETLEYVAYKIYENENYWDLILAINGEDPLFDMYLSFEAITDLAITKVTSFETKVYNRPLDSITKDYLLALWNKETLDLNDTRRVIKVIKPHRLQDFMRILKEAGYAQ